MLERFKNYFGKLERLSDGELDRSAFALRASARPSRSLGVGWSAEKLVCAEKQNVAKVIAEMSRRKVALELGYKSTFHYCVERLRLSEGSVASRIHVANVSIRFPQLLVALAENRISLTVAGLLAPHLSENNVDKLLGDCAGMTKKAVLEYLVRIEPKAVFKPSIRRRPARPLPVEPAPALAERPAAPPRELTTGDRQLSPSSHNILQPARPAVFNFRFSANRSFKEKFERLAEVMGVENAQKHMAEILEQALDVALDKKDPKRKLERRKARQMATKTTPRPEEMSVAEPAFRWNTSGRLPSFAATTSDSFGFCALPTIAWRPNMSTGRNSSNGRSIRGGRSMKGGGVGTCWSTSHGSLELHSSSLSAMSAFLITRGQQVS